SGTTGTSSRSAAARPRLEWLGRSNNCRDAVCVVLYLSRDYRRFYEGQSLSRTDAAAAPSDAFRSVLVIRRRADLYASDSSLLSAPLRRCCALALAARIPLDCLPAGRHGARSPGAVFVVALAHPQGAAD